MKMFDRLAGALNMPLAVVSFEHTCDCLIIIAYPHILFANVSFSIKTIKLFLCIIYSMINSQFGHGTLLTMTCSLLNSSLIRDLQTDYSVKLASKNLCSSI